MGPDTGSDPIIASGLVALVATGTLIVLAISRSLRPKRASASGPSGQGSSGTSGSTPPPTLLLSSLLVTVTCIHLSLLFLWAVTASGSSRGGLLAMIVSMVHVGCGAAYAWKVRGRR